MNIASCLILCLQETWLLDSNMDLLSNAHKDYYYTGVSGADSKNYIIQGRPHGGVAILRHKYLSNKITVLMTGNKLIYAISVNISDKQSVSIITVYMPCVSRSHSPDEEFIDVLNNVEQPLVQSSCNYVIIYVMLYYVIIISTQHTCHSSWRMLFCIMCGITQMPNVITHI